MKNNALILCACDELLSSIDDYIEKASNKLASKLKKAGFLKAKFSVKRLSELEDKLTSALEKETEAVTEGAKKANKLEDINLDKLLSDNSAKKEIAGLVSSHYSDVLPELTDAYIKQADKGLAYITATKRTSAWVGEWSEKLADLMDITSQKDKIAELLDNHIKGGKGIDDFVKALQESGIRNERYRARTVAVTETLRAHSVAHDDARLQNPCVVEKIWRHTGLRNNTPRPNHVAMNGQKVKKDETFTLIGADGSTYQPKYPRDPVLPVGETANCHCIAQDGIDEDILGLPLEERQKMQEEALADLDDDWEKEMDEKHKEEHSTTE